MKSLPPVKNKKDLQKILGIMNICRGLCLGFGTWVQGLYKLSSKRFPTDIQERIQEVWRKILECYQHIYRGDVLAGKEYHLFTDWCQEEMGYVLMVGEITEGKITGINSKKKWRKAK